MCSHLPYIRAVWRSLPILLFYSFTDVGMAIESINGCVGYHALFNCNIVPDPGGDPFINMRWMYGAMSISQLTHSNNQTFIHDDYKDRATLTWSTLKLDELTGTDAGQYSCLVKHSNDVADTQNITLDVYQLQDCALPKPNLYLNGSLINNNQRDILSRELYTIATTAPKNNPPAVNITYEVDYGFGKPVFHSCNQTGETECQTRLQADLNRTSLVAVKVILTHPAATLRSVEWNFTVLASPLFIGELQDTNVTINQGLGVSCAFMAKPSAQISWLNADESSVLPADIFSVEGREFVDGNYKVTAGELQWNSKSLPTQRRGKGGKIKCRATNNLSQPIFSNTMNLDVHYPPYAVNVWPPSKEVVEFGYLPEVKCSALCNPPCTYSWQDPAGDSFSGNMQIANVTRENHGHYKCMASNNLPEGDGPSNFSLVVFYGPDVKQLTVTPPSGILNKSDDAIFNCNVDSRPESNMTLLDPDGTVLHSVTSVNNLQHNFSNIDCLNSGVYHCETRNAKTGRVNKTPLHVAVKCPPRKYTSSSNTVGAVDGDTVSFTITTIAFPQPKFTWYFKGSVIPEQSGTTVFGVTGKLSADVFNTSTLTLHNVTKEEFGNYSVVAENSLDKMMAEVFMLVPAGPPDTPSELMKYHTNAVSITMQWTSGWNRGGEQVFTLMYRRSDSDDNYTNITDISNPGEYENVTGKVDALSPNTSYEVKVVATNRHGFSQTSMVTVSTPARPDFGSENGDGISIRISGNVATITWILNSYGGPITCVDVNSCVSDLSRCILTANNTPSASSVKVVLPAGGSSYIFEFLLYDRDDLLASVKRSTTVGPESPVGIIVGVLVAVVVLIVAAVVGFILWRRNSHGDARKDKTNPSEMGHVNPVMVSDDDISLTANGKHDTMSEGHQMVVENTLYASSGPARDDHMDQPYAEVPVVTGNRVTGAKSPRKKNKAKGKKGKGNAVQMNNLYTESDTAKGNLHLEDIISPYEDVDGTHKPKGAGPVDSLLPEYAEVDRSQKPKKGSAAPPFAEYADVNVVKKNKHAKKPQKSDFVEPEVVEYEEVDFKKKSTGDRAAAAAWPGVAMGAAALPEYGQVDLSKKHKQGEAAKPPHLEEYAQVDFSKKNKKESEAADKDKPPVKGKKPKPGAPPPRPARAASVDEGERAQRPPDHQPHYGVEGTLYADLDLINATPTCAEPTVHANLEPSEYASIDALRLTTRPADQ